MYYRRLRDIYDKHISTDVNFRYRFSEKWVHQFDHFIRENISKGNKYLSPYSFAIDYGLRTDDTIQFFILYSGDEGILNIVPFFECPNVRCTDERIYIEDGHDGEDPLFCDECERPYYIEEIRHYIKLYFELKPDLLIPVDLQKTIFNDPNATYETLQGIPDYLKGESPSLLSETHDSNYHGEGDSQDGVPLDRVYKSDITLPSDVKISLERLDKFEKLKKRLQFGLEGL